VTLSAVTLGALGSYNNEKSIVKMYVDETSSCPVHSRLAVILSEIGPDWRESHQPPGCRDVMRRSRRNRVSRQPVLDRAARPALTESTTTFVRQGHQLSSQIIQ